MKALIKGDETYTEEEWSDFTRNHIPFMTGTEKDAEGKNLPGAGWTLVDNYVAATEETEESYDVVETVTEEETVTINGVTYTKSQLRALLGE